MPPDSSETTKRATVRVPFPLLPDQLRADAEEVAGWGAGNEAERLRQAAEEIERLQRIIDSRPAINAGLPETYIEWSQSIYLLDYVTLTGKKQ